MGGVGSKVAAGRDQPLIAMMPPHGTCIETHPGGGAIMKRKPPAGGDPGGLFGAMFAWPGWSLSEASCP